MENNYLEYNQVAKNPIRLITILYVFLKFLFYWGFDAEHPHYRAVSGVITILLIYLFTGLKVFDRPYLPLLVTMTLTVVELAFLVLITGDRLAYYFLAAIPLICLLYLHLKSLVIVIISNTVVTSLIVFVGGTSLLRAEATPADEINNFMGMIVMYIVIYLIARFSIRKIIESQKAAEIATRSKSGFLATISHEVRTPLNAIIGISEVNLQKNLPAGYAGDIEKIHTAGRSLLGMINDILDMSKIESGKLDVKPEEYDTPGFINDTVHLNMIRIGSKGISFSLEIDENFPSKLYGDELRVKQILNNLLSNAIKYTQEGFVKLSVRHDFLLDELFVIFTIEDSGQGIKQDDLPNIFTEYMRFNHEENQAVEGTGLGLVITKLLVGLMDGTIHVQSEYGRGSKFTVRIKQGFVESPPIGAETANRLRSFTYSESRFEKKEFDVIECGQVLVVDDVESNLYVAQEMLALFDIETESAGSGAAAIEKIRAGKTYDLIFMDHMMPEMDGIEATKILRESGYTGTIIALTANATADVAEMFIESGIDDFISKPLDTTRLGVILNKWIG